MRGEIDVNLLSVCWSPGFAFPRIPLLNQTQLGSSTTAFDGPKCAMRAPLGPHPVGVHDARLPDSGGGQRVRLFYPAASDSRATRPPRWMLPSENIIDETAVGFARYVLPDVVARGAALFMTPVFAQRLEHAKQDAEVAEGNWPVILFSPGLCSNAQTYSLICMDMASHGHMVAAVEHTDGSSVTAFVGSQRKHIPFKKYSAEVHGPMWEFYRDMLDIRVGDFEALLSCLRVASATGGTPLEPLSGRQTDSYRLLLADRINCENVSLAGHSFGSATCVGFAMRHPGLPRRVLCLDAWLFSLDKKVLCGKSTCPLRQDLDLFFVDADFSFTRESRKTRSEIAGGNVEAVTAVRAMHVNTSDFPSFLPSFVAHIAKMSPRGGDPEALLRAQSIASCAFITGSWSSLKNQISESSNGELHGLTLRDPVGNS